MLKNINIEYFGNISSYNLFIGLGIIFGILYYNFKNKKLSDNYKFKIYNLLFISFIFGFIGSRVFDIIFFNKSFNIDNLLYGSSTFMGGLLFSLISIKIISVILKINFFPIFNSLIPFIIISHFFGRIGCFLSGCCFGEETHKDYLFGVTFPEGSIPYNFYGKLTEIHPTQLYESFLLIPIFFLLKNKKNMITPYLIFYGIIRFLIEFYRNDPRGDMILNILSPSQFLSLIFILIGFIVYYLNHSKIIILNEIEITR